jgi:CheY-like chemotaxis protein
VTPQSELRKILLVEDSPYDVEMTLEALEEYRLANKIDVVGDGPAALDYLFRRNSYAARRGEHPVVVLLDLKLPKLSGLEVLKAIRQAPELASIPVVMLTSSREEPDLEQCYRAGCNAYVVKPVGFAAFTEALRTVGCFWAVLNEPCANRAPQHPPLAN